jgi:hypothetical protein
MNLGGDCKYKIRDSREQECHAGNPHQYPAMEIVCNN